TDEFLNSYKGKWLMPDVRIATLNTNVSRDDIIKRLNAIHDLVWRLYPQPMGSDAGWFGEGFTKTSFADEVKYIPVNDRDPDETKTRINPVYSYSYTCGLSPWICTGKQNEIMNMYPEASSGGIYIFSNRLDILNENYASGDEWRIEGRPIKRKMFAAGKWKGCDLMTDVGGINANLVSSHFVLISRDGMLPYIPITRKQFLDRAIRYVTRYYDELEKKLIVINEELPAQVRPPQKEFDDQNARNKKAKNDAIKKLQDELEETKKKGLLDSAAVVRIDPLLMFEGPVFLPESEGGCMLATENPNYFRTDLPKYVPQFFVLELSWSEQTKWSMDFKKIIEDDFPMEKLQAMIDK
ncbi:MAG: hypothetical protein HYR66_06535, partial [Sphingobacteriales bacterium]|nr:hypothetical protein [Sphingobacteriales bacterium]